MSPRTNSKTARPRWRERREIKGYYSLHTFNVHLLQWSPFGNNMAIAYSPQTLACNSKWPKTKQYLIKNNDLLACCCCYFFRYQRFIRLAVNPFSSPRRIFFSVYMQIQPMVCKKKNPNKPKTTNESGAESFVLYGEIIKNARSLEDAPCARATRTRAVQWWLILLYLSTCSL